MIWNDPQDPGYPIKNSGFAVGSTGNTLNPADQGVHIQQATPCGPLDQSGLTTSGGKTFQSGQWGPISHVYAAASDVPTTVCVNMYDPHSDSSISDVTNALHDFNAVGNNDNSIETNGFNPSAGSCFSPVQAGLISGHIYDCNNGATPPVGRAVGSIALAGKQASANPVGPIVVNPGSYAASAVCPRRRWPIWPRSA